MTQPSSRIPDARTVSIKCEEIREWKTSKNPINVSGRGANAPGPGRTIIAANIAATPKKAEWTMTADAGTGNASSSRPVDC